MEGLTRNSTTNHNDVTARLRLVQVTLKEALIRDLEQDRPSVLYMILIRPTAARPYPVPQGGTAYRFHH